MLFLWWVKRVRQLTFLKAVGEDNGKFLVGRHTHTLLDYAGPHRSGMTGVGYFSQVGSRTGKQENGWKGEVTPHGPSYMVRRRRGRGIAQRKRVRAVRNG